MKNQNKMYKCIGFVVVCIMLVFVFFLGMMLIGFVFNVQIVVGGEEFDVFVILDVQSMEGGVFFFWMIVVQWDVIVNLVLSFMFFNIIFGCLEINLGSVVMLVWLVIVCLEE